MLGEGGFPLFAAAVLASREGGHRQRDIVELDHKVGKQIRLVLPAGRNGTSVWNNMLCKPTCTTYRNQDTPLCGHKQNN